MKHFIYLFLFSLSTIFTFAQTSTTDSLNKDTLIQKLIIGYKESPPFVVKNQDGLLSGLSIHLAQEISLQLKRPIEFREYPLKELLAAVENGEVDMTVNPITVTEERIQRMVFSQPFAISHLSVAVNPQDDSDLISFIKNFFSLNFLKAISLLFLVILFFGFLVWLFERKSNPDFGDGIKGVFDSIWFSSVTMTTVGYGDKSPKTKGGRIITMIWMFAALIIISGFTGSIAASLTANKLSDRIDDFGDLRKMKVGTLESTASQFYLEKRRVKHKGYESIRLGLEALENGEIEAFFYDEPLIRNTMEENEHLQEIEILNFKFNPQYYSFAYPKGSQLEDQLNPVILKLIGTDEWQDMTAKYGLGQ